LLAGCPPTGPVRTPRPPRAEKWFQRALGEFQRASIDAAYESARQALELVPEDDEVKLLVARASLARLEFDEVLQQLKNVKGTAASALLGRAYWYKGELERAADQLEQLLTDPEVNDPWAREITKLARRGTGRRPFEISTTVGRVVSVQMARVAPGQPFFVVPLEIDGEKALALIATGTPEVMLDSATRREPSWVSLRFGQRLEVKDVPALTRDLSALSRELGAPIKALLGANLLRHLNATMDHRGRQFVARNFIPPPPPMASRVDVYYLRGGGMILGSALGAEREQMASLLVDTSMRHRVALDLEGWRKAGIDAATLPVLGKGPDGMLRGGAIPLMKLGAFPLPQVEAIYGAPFGRLEKELNIDIDGALGAALLQPFRLTFSDGGRVLWVEQIPPVPPASRQKLPPLPAIPGARPPQRPAGVPSIPTAPPLVMPPGAAPRGPPASRPAPGAGGKLNF